VFKPIGQMLPGALSRLKVRRPVEATLVCRACDEALGSLWDHAVPMRAVSYRGGTVTIAVTSAAWGHEVQMQGEIIKERVNRALGGAPLSRVKAKVAPTAAGGPQPFEES
jgi:hypothetical protein